MKIKGIRSLFLFIAGISLTGCEGFLDSDSGKSAYQLKREGRSLLEDANRMLVGNEHTCIEIVTAVEEALVAVESATTQAQAREAKKLAKNAKEKTENCTKQGEGIEEAKRAVVVTADKAIKLADAELKKSQESNRSNAQKILDESIFNGAQADALAAKSAAEVATTTEEAKEAKKLAENALKRIQNQAK